MNTQEFLWQMGRVSLQAGVLAVLVLLVQWLARDRLSPRWRCALWGLVLVRLMVPTLPEARWSVFNWMPLPTRSTQSILSTSSISAPAVIPRAQVPSESIEMPAPRHLKWFRLKLRGRLNPCRSNPLQNLRCRGYRIPSCPALPRNHDHQAGFHEGRSGCSRSGCVVSWVCWARPWRTRST
jgi:hypothetical protein